MTPKTEYASSGGTRIAYQVFGEGAIDLAISPGYISHLEMWWMLPETTAFLRRLASFARVIMYDKRGTGLSDPAASAPTLDERMEDMHAVLDAAESERPAIVGYSEGGPTALLYAATYPERVRALALNGTFAVGRPSGDMLEPYGIPDEEARAYYEEQRSFMEDAVGHWGEGRTIEKFAPTAAPEPAMRRRWAMFERMAASPAMVEGLLDCVFSIDVSGVLGTIRVPTHVSHRRGDLVIPFAWGQFVADNIPGAEFVPLEGEDHVPWLGDMGAILDPLEAFLTGTRADVPVDRALATILFTDIVGSTERAAELGDSRWRELLERHDEFIKREVAAGGGRLVKSLGDGMLARFDGPGRGIECAHRIVSAAPEELGVEIRAGLHTGECEIRGDDLGGLAVHLGARIGAEARGGEVLVSRSVRDLVIGTPIAFTDRGTYELKGVPGEWQLLAAEPERAGAPGRPRPSFEIAPNAELARPADRAAGRLARSAPAVGRALNRLTSVGARRRVRRRRGTPAGA